ncbi:MAG: tetratricopeptide repeat protein [Bacteroidia bacterium]
MEAMLSKNNTKIYNTSSQIGFYYIGQNEDDSAVSYYNVALKHAKTPIEKADAYMGMAKSTLFTKSVYSMKSAKKGLTFVQDTDCVARVNLINVIGIYYSLNGKYDSSLYFYKIGLSTAEKLKDEILISKLKGNLGDVYSYMGKYDIALRYQLQVLDFQQRKKDSVNMVRSFINVGNTYNYMFQDSIALTYYMRAYPLLKDKKSRMSGNLFNSIALAYEGLCDSLKPENPKWQTYTALQKKYLQQSLAVKTVLKDSIGIANTLLNFGRLAIKMKHTPEAIRYFNESLTIGEKIDNQRLIRANCSALGDVYCEQKDYPKALVFFFRMNEMAEHDSDLNAQHDALHSIYRTYEIMGDYKNAFEYLAQYKNVIYALNSKEKEKEIADAEAKYKNQEKQRENDNLMYDNQLKTIENNKAKEEKQSILIFSGVGLLLILLIFYLFYRNAQIKAKAEEQQKVTKAVFESEQKERIRISRDLHDNVGTQLSLISNDIEWITHPLKTFTETEKSERLESIGTASKEVINTLRETIWALNKEEVSFEEFADKLKAHVQKQVKLSKNVQPSFNENLESTIMLGPSEALGLFRICQEAIANSLKYAHSEKLEISMSTENEKYKLSIADYGKGFDKLAISRDSNYGLANMKFRAEEISCTINIDSSPEKGTIVTIAKK